MMIRALSEYQRTTVLWCVRTATWEEDTYIFRVFIPCTLCNDDRRHIAVELWTQDYVPRSAAEQSATFPTFFPSKTVIICRRLEARTTATRRHQAQAGVRQRSAAFLDNYFLCDLPLPGLQ